MSRPVLVAYASKHGSTAEVAEVVASSLVDRGLVVDVRPVGEVDDLSPYGGIVFGGALYMGRLHADGRRFLRQHRAALAAVPFAVFAMGPGSLEEKDVSGSRAQLERALETVPEVVPFAVAIFGGVVRREELRFPFNRMPETDARDWDAIHHWAESLPGHFGSEPGVPARPLGVATTQ